jgi:hypothetical protein
MKLFTTMGLLQEDKFSQVALTLKKWVNCKMKIEHFSVKTSKCVSNKVKVGKKIIFFAKN